MVDIIVKSNELIDSIKNSKVYEKYVFLRNEMLKDKKIADLIEKVKTIQKKLVREKSIGKSTDALERKIDAVLLELNKIPLYVQYDCVQCELNEILQNVKSTIESCINDITN